MFELIMKEIKQSTYDVGFYVIDMMGNSFGYCENQVFEAASCIKLFILLEYFKQVYEGKKSLQDKFIYTQADNIEGVNFGIISSMDYGLELTSKDYAMLMIIYSDNIATNKLIHYLGIDNINATIKELGFKDTFLLHELDLLKFFEFGKTTPYEYARAYQMILSGKMINQKISSQMLEILKKQRSNDMLVNDFPILDVLSLGMPDSNINYIASKDGTIVWTGKEMKNVRNDGGIISTVYGSYVISIFVSNVDDLQLNSNNKAIQLGARISKIIFDNFIQNKGFLNEK